MMSVELENGSGKSVAMEVRIWLNDGTGHIHIASKDAQFISTVSNDPTSARYHKNLFGKLARVLSDAGAPHPDLSDSQVVTK